MHLITLSCVCVKLGVAFLPFKLVEIGHFLLRAEGMISPGIAVNQAVQLALDVLNSEGKQRIQYVNLAATQASGPDHQHCSSLNDLSSCFPSMRARRESRGLNKKVHAHTQRKKKKKEKRSRSYRLFFGATRWLDTFDLVVGVLRLVLVLDDYLYLFVFLV